VTRDHAEAPDAWNDLTMAGTELDLAPTTRDLLEQAAAAARRAADRAGTVVRPLETLAELDEGSRLISRIWDDEDGEPKAPTSLLRALAHAGSFVAGAFQGDRLVGVSFGFFGLESADLHLHSHITGVDRAFQGRSIGFALKQFQRSWALERDTRTIVWTADPLVRGNAFFNLVKLGATMAAYHENFYGVLEDGLNAGDSDRVVVRWDLASDRAVRAAEGPTEDPCLDGGCVVLREDANGEPAVSAPSGDVLLAWLPPSIVAIREHDPECASAWRLALRETVGRALADEFRADAITRDGWLVLRR
jgi:predicted GNAT superfamily acetyltransferase